MTTADLFYRAFRELDRLIAEDRGAESLIGGVAKAPGAERISVTHNVCTVEEDWILAIERGLVFIGQAIEEDRQFIRSDGELQPIEKVRHISKESVLHLSRHSDLIPEDQRDAENIVPNKLYTVERNSDYAVYENRFLYLLLLRIRDFVGVRYEAIMRAYRAYRGEYTVTKTLVTGTRRLSYEIRLTDEEDDVISAPADSACAERLERLDKIRQSVAFYLRTPLMVEVSRADKIKSKITKTNVLRMNKKFREALELYEFLLAYGKDGYTIEERVDVMDPVPGEAARELAVPVALTAFSVYACGLGLGPYFGEEYAKEEARRAEEAKEERARKIAALKKRIAESGGNAERYMLLLEEQNAALEEDRRNLKKAREEIEELRAAIDRLNNEIAVCGREIERLEEEVVRINEEMARAEEAHRAALEEMQRAHEAQLAALNEEHAGEIARLNGEHEAEKEALSAKHARELAEAQEAHAAELARLKEEYLSTLSSLKTAQEQEIARLKAAFRAEEERTRSACEEKLREGQARLEEYGQTAARAQAELSDANARLSVAMRSCEVLAAELTAVRKEHGLLGAEADFTTEEGFDRLEHEFEVLGRLVRDEWTDVKRILRKEFYGNLRATVKKPRAKKSKEYLTLQEDVRAAQGKREGGSPAARSNGKPPAVPAGDGEGEGDGARGGSGE